MRPLSRLFRKPKPKPSKPWQPLYYPTNTGKPLPWVQQPAEIVNRLPDDLSRAQITRHGFEAWLGLMSIRKEGCQTCMACTHPNGEVLLNFYAMQPDPPGDGYIGAYWHKVDYQGQTETPFQFGSQPVEGALGTSNRLADYKTLHYRCTDGRVWTRAGEVESAPPGGTVMDGGALKAYEAGSVPHASVEWGQHWEGPDAVLVSWDPEEVRGTMAFSRKSDDPGKLLWTYPKAYNFVLPNVWRQEHP